MRRKPILTEMPHVALTLSSTIKTMRDLMRGIFEYASLCGFTAQSHFSTAFRRRFGVTPSVFRSRR